MTLGRCSGVFDVGTYAKEAGAVAAAGSSALLFIGLACLELAVEFSAGEAVAPLLAASAAEQGQTRAHLIAMLALKRLVA
jgi:hypothetical protein